MPAYRYYRFNGISNSAGSYPQVAECQLMIGGTDQIPTMTSGTTSGVTMSGDSIYTGGQDPFYAGANDGTTNLFGSGASPSSNAFLKVDFGAGNAKQIESYSLQCPSATTTYMWTAWTLAGSNDDSAYTTVDTRSGQSWTTSQVQTYTITWPVYAPVFLPNSFIHMIVR